jgi:hypothetical protein
MLQESRTSTLCGLFGAGAALLWAMARSGFTLNPVLEDMVTAADLWPQRTEAWMTQFYADSPLYIIAANAFGLVNEVGLVRQSFVVAVAALIALAAWVWRFTLPPQKFRGARLLILAPIGAVLFSSIGSYDPFTALAWAIALWLWVSGRPLLVIAGGLALGVQHFEQALLGITSLFLAWLALREDLPDKLRMSNPLWLVPGIVIGKALLTALFVVTGGLPTGRTEWLGRYVTEWTKIGIATFPYLLWALFAGLWLVVVIVWLRSRWASRLLLIAAAIPGLFGTILSGDRPRVFVFILLPALMITVVALLNRKSTRASEARLVEIIAWLAPPLILAGKTAPNANIFDNGYVSIMWITGLGGP